MEVPSYKNKPVKIKIKTKEGIICLWAKSIEIQRDGLIYIETDEVEFL